MEWRNQLPAYCNQCTYNNFFFVPEIIQPPRMVIQLLLMQESLIFTNNISFCVLRYASHSNKNTKKKSKEESCAGFSVFGMDINSNGTSITMMLMIRLDSVFHTHRHRLLQLLDLYSCARCLQHLLYSFLLHRPHCMGKTTRMMP